MSIINDLLDHIKRVPAQPRFYHRIPDDHMLDDRVTSLPIKKDNSYIDIRLSEMFLANRSEYFQGFIPFTLAITDMLCDHEASPACRESIPFIVGNQLLAPIVSNLQNESVEYRDTRIAGPLPYVGDDLGLFVALYRAKVSDLSKQLFEFLDNLVNTIGMGNVSSYLKMGESLVRGLSALFGVGKDIEYRLGAKYTFKDSPGDPSELKEGYIVYINCPESEMDAERLWVKNHRLHTGNREDNSPFRANDYCLIRVDQKTTRPYESLPFHEVWKQAKDFIWNGNHEQADALFLYLAQQVARSADLTQSDRFQVQLIYKANFEREIERFHHLRHPVTESTTRTRGGWTGSDARSVIQMTAEIAEKEKMPMGLQNSLWEIREHWEDIPYLSDPITDFVLTDEVFNDQLRALSNIIQTRDQDPESLARTFALSRLSPT